MDGAQRLPQSEPMALLQDDLVAITPCNVRISDQSEGASLSPQVAAQCRQWGDDGHIALIIEKLGQCHRKRVKVAEPEFDKANAIVIGQGAINGGMAVSAQWEEDQLNDTPAVILQ